uniref:39kDa core protein OPG130 n=1 Tax=Sheeppox virus TaxID=10266 RepID=A0A218NAA2_SHEV|nr:virion core protein [Sheeppox virus]
MDFMKKYTKDLETTVRNKKDEEIASTSNLINNKSVTLTDVDTMLKSKEHLYQQMMINQLEEKKTLKIKNIEIKNNSNKLNDQCSEKKQNDPLKKIKSISHDELVEELKDIKDKTKSLQDDSDSLIKDISVAKDTTFDAINSIMNNLKKRLNIDKLDDNNSK